MKFTWCFILTNSYHLAQDFPTMLNHARLFQRSSLTSRFEDLLRILDVAVSAGVVRRGDMTWGYPSVAPNGPWEKRIVSQKNFAIQIGFHEVISYDLNSWE